MRNAIHIAKEHIQTARQRGLAFSFIAYHEQATPEELD